MPKYRVLALSVSLLLGWFSVGTLLAFEVPIEVSPNVLNINSESQVVTVHTGIPYNAVEFTSVFLNGISIESWKADAQGYFVAKFSSEEVKTLDGLRIGEENRLTLLGMTSDGEAFAGEDTILVIEVGPQPVAPRGK